MWGFSRAPRLARLTTLSARAWFHAADKTDQLIGELDTQSSSRVMVQPTSTTHHVNQGKPDSASSGLLTRSSSLSITVDLHRSANKQPTFSVAGSVTDDDDDDDDAIPTMTFPASASHLVRSGPVNNSPSELDPIYRWEAPNLRSPILLWPIWVSGRLVYASSQPPFQPIDQLPCVKHPDKALRFTTLQKQQTTQPKPWRPSSSPFATR